MKSFHLFAMKIWKRVSIVSHEQRNRETLADLVHTACLSNYSFFFGFMVFLYVVRILWATKMSNLELATKQSFLELRL
jgi:hypothetical protein